MALRSSLEGGAATIIGVTFVLSLCGATDTGTAFMASSVKASAHTVKAVVDTVPLFGKIMGEDSSQKPAKKVG